MPSVQSPDPDALLLQLLFTLQETKPGRFVSGDEVSHGDLALFVSLSCLKSGAGMFSGEEFNQFQLPVIAINSIVHDATYTTYDRRIHPTSHCPNT